MAAVHLFRARGDARRKRWTAPERAVRQGPAQAVELAEFAGASRLLSCVKPPPGALSPPGWRACFIAMGWCGV